MDIARNPGIVAVLNLACFLKTLRVNRIWEKDAWELMMERLDETVFGVSEADLLSILEYRGLTMYAAAYLGECPDEEKAVELSERIKREIKLGYLACLDQTFSVEEREKRLRILHDCEETAKALK